MKDFLVTWEIQISASSAFEAACFAYEIQRDPNHTANTFFVTNDQGEPVTINLDDLE